MNVSLLNSICIFASPYISQILFDHSFKGLNNNIFPFSMLVSAAKKQDLTCVSLNSEALVLRVVVCNTTVADCFSWFYYTSCLRCGRREFERLSLVSPHGCTQNWFFYLHSFYLWWPRTDIISFSITPSIQRRRRPLSSPHFLPQITGLLMPLLCDVYRTITLCLEKAWPSLKALCAFSNLDYVNLENTLSRSQSQNKCHYYYQGGWKRKNNKGRILLSPCQGAVLHNYDTLSYINQLFRTETFQYLCQRLWMSYNTFFFYIFLLPLYISYALRKAYAAGGLWAL